MFRALVPWYYASNPITHNPVNKWKVHLGNFRKASSDTHTSWLLGFVLK